MSVEEEFEKWLGTQPYINRYYPENGIGDVKSAYLAGREKGYAEGRSDERKRIKEILDDFPSECWCEPESGIKCTFCSDTEKIISLIERQEGV